MTTILFFSGDVQKTFVIESMKAFCTTDHVEIKNSKLSLLYEQHST